MKIAIITLNNPFEKISGGIESVVYNLSRALARLGHEVWVVCLGNTKNEIIEKRDGVNLWILPDKGAKGFFMRSLIFISYGRKIVRKLEGEGIEIFNGQGGLSSPLAFYKPKRAKVVLTIHTLDGENIANIRDCIRMRKFKELLLEILKYPILKLWRILYLSRADYLIFVSRVVQKEFRKYYWFLKKSYSIIPNGFPKIDINFRLVKKKYDFIYVGRLDKRKCADLIIKSSKILKDKGYNFSIVIIGDGPWRNDIEELIYKYDLSKNIYLIGYLDDYYKVLTYILESKFLIGPSSYESDLLVVREALSLGVPCIVSDIPVLREKIENNFNGFLFKKLDYIDLANVMERALNLNKKEYEILSKNAKESIINKSWDEIAMDYAKVFKILITNDKNE